MVVAVTAAVCFTDHMYKDLALDVEVSDVVKPGSVFEATYAKIMRNAPQDNKIVGIGLIKYEVKQ